MSDIDAINNKLITPSQLSDDKYYKASWALKQVTLYSTGVGVLIDLKNLFIGTFDDLNLLEDDGEYGSKTILKCRNKLLETNNDKVSNFIRYPVDFHRRHKKAMYRKACIFEFERVLDQVLRLENDIEMQKELSLDYKMSFTFSKLSMTSERVTDPLTNFLDILITLYVQDLQLSKVPRLIEYSYRLGLLGFTGSYYDYYIKANKLRDGIDFIKSALSSYDREQLYVGNMEHLLGILKHQEESIKQGNKKPYKPRKRKDIVFDQKDLMIYRGTFSWESDDE